MKATEITVTVSRDGKKDLVVPMGRLKMLGAQEIGQAEVFNESVLVKRDGSIEIGRSVSYSLPIESIDADLKVGPLECLKNFLRKYYW